MSEEALEEEEEEKSFFVVSELEAGQRLDVLLTQHFEGKLSRTYFQKLIKEGSVELNGQIVKKCCCPAVGDLVKLCQKQAEELLLIPQNIPLSIIYEDEVMIVIDKAAGMVAHPAPGNWSGTFVNALLYHCQNLSQNFANSPVLVDAFRPGIVHRLDKDTSGVLIAAKTVEAQHKLCLQFAERKVYKEYLAIAIGEVEERGSIEAALGRHPTQRQKMAVLPDDKGRAARTHYERIGYTSALSSPGLSLLKIILETGRTHQIRVHLRHIGFPLLGDALYGNSEINQKLVVPRQMLHARCISLCHPLSGQKMHFSAAIPPDLAAFFPSLLSFPETSVQSA